MVWVVIWADKESLATSMPTYKKWTYSLLRISTAESLVTISSRIQNTSGRKVPGYLIHRKTRCTYLCESLEDSGCYQSASVLSIRQELLTPRRYSIQWEKIMSGFSGGTLGVFLISYYMRVQRFAKEKLERLLEPKNQVKPINYHHTNSFFS